MLAQKTVAATFGLRTIMVTRRTFNNAKANDSNKTVFIFNRDLDEATRLPYADSLIRVMI
jgi:hypothetical protein